MPDVQEDSCPEITPVDNVRKLVRDELLPLHMQNGERLNALERDHLQLKEQVVALNASSNSHGSKLIRIEGKIETIVGSPNAEGQLPKIERRMEEEYGQARSFRHSSLNSHQLVLDSLYQIKLTMAHNEGTAEGARNVKGKVAEWVKWLLGGIAAYLVGHTTGPGSAVWEAVKHYAWK